MMAMDRCAKRHKPAQPTDSPETFLERVDLAGVSRPEPTKMKFQIVKKRSTMLQLKLFPQSEESEVFFCA